MYASPEQRATEIAQGATLPARALRHLFDHSEVHLNVEWRDLGDADWEASVRTAQGRTVPVRETPWMRTREVWIHAVDLAGTASYLDFPRPVLDRLLEDVVSAWDRRGATPDLVLEPADAEPRVLGAGGVTVTGALADLVRWLTGRGPRRLSTSGTELPVLPRWL